MSGHIRKISSIFAGLLLLVSNAHSDPSKQINSLMFTQASAFDFFLFQLHEKSKCQTWFGNKDMPNMCMTTINYDFDDNLIKMNFIASNTYPQLEGFKAASEEERIELMKSSMADLASLLGITKGFGLIQFTPIRYGWSAKSLNEDEAKKEIIKRTVLYLHFRHDGKSYTAKRDHHGEVSVKFK